MKVTKIIKLYFFKAKVYIMTKEEIIQKAKILINKHKSIEKIKLNSLLINIGISKGSFYHHFKSKDDLLYQIISPDVKEYNEELKQNIKNLNNIRDKLYLLFEPFIKKNEKLIYLENFYRHLFFEEEIKKSKVFKKLFIEIKNNRKLLITQALKSSGIKVDKKLIVLIEYIDNTIIFYHLQYKILHNKKPQNEILKLLNMISSLIEKQYKKI